MGAYSEQTYASAARGTQADEARWDAVRESGRQGWEGESQTTANVMQATEDAGCFVTWNAGKQFATRDNLHGAATRAEIARWELVLDTMVALKHDFLAMQETGAGGSRADEIRVRGILEQWSRKRGTLARIWLAGSTGFSDEGKDLRGLGGTAGGLALIAIGKWAARGRAARRFPNGRGLWVEFHEGARLLCVGNVYGPSGASESVHEEWRNAVTTERDEAEARGLSTILMGDFNCRREDNEAGNNPRAEIDAWFNSEEIVDVWRTRHRLHKGYTRQASDDRDEQDQAVQDGAEWRITAGTDTKDRVLSRSRIDYIGLGIDIAATDIVGAWLGPWGDGFAIKSDHRPLAAVIRLQGLLGSIEAVPQGAVDQPEPDYPPRHWFYVTDTDRQQAMADIEAGKLPRKLPRDAFGKACATEPVLAALQQLAILQGTATNKADLAEVWHQTRKVGRAIKEVLRPQRRDRVTVGKQDMYTDASTKAYSRILGLQFWTRKIRRKGDKIFDTPTTKEPAHKQVPDEIWDLWGEARTLSSTQETASPETTLEETMAAWAHAKASAQTAKVTKATKTMPTAHSSLDWLLILLRIRISTAIQGIKKVQAGAKAAKQMIKRLQVAEAAEQGKTGGIYEPIKPYTKPISVDGALCKQTDGTTVWRTDDESKRQSARDHCYQTTELTAERTNRGTRLSPVDRASGLLDDQFQTPALERLRAIALQRKEPIAADELVQDWTGDTLRAAVAGCSDTAPGPSGLCYWMIATTTDEMRDLLAEAMNLYQAARYMPDGMRHSYVYPIPKSCIGGATFQGARQICFLETLLKLITGEITQKAMAIWEERQYLHPAQNGFRKHHNAGDLASFVVAVEAMYRAKGKPLFTVSADITKAFQSLGICGVEASLLRMGIPEDVMELWMQSDRGEWFQGQRADGLWEASYGTCQVITGSAGLSPSFETETGLRQGSRCAPTKYSAWMDILWCWLDAEEVQGLSLPSSSLHDSINIPVLGFCDDIWAGSETFEGLQRIVSLVDSFLAAYGVDLNPSKSMYAKINSKDARAIVIYREQNGSRIAVPLQEVAATQGYRYLGIMLQPDGGWQSMAATVMCKIRAWTRQISKAQIPVDQAVMVMRSVVGGLLNYVLTAAPLSNALMEKIDKLTAAAIFSCAGLARGRRTAWAFRSAATGGFGATSAVILRRAIIIEKVATWLNAHSPI